MATKPILEAVSDSLKGKTPEEQFSEMVASYEATMAEKRREYEALVAQSVATLESLIADNSPREEIPDPLAQWIETDEGEEFLVLNQSAAALYKLIFDRMADIISELQKTNLK